MILTEYEWADNINRRTVIRTLGIDGLVGIAGCAALRDGSDGGDRAGEETEHADLSIAAVNSEWTSPTRMMAEIAVENDGDVRGSATLYFEVDVDVGGTYRESEHISVAPGDRTTYTFDVEIDPSELMGAERADTRAWLEQWSGLVPTSVKQGVCPKAGTTGRDR